MNELHLFAGAGGGILGGMLLGHTPVCAVEIEPYCRKVLLQRQRDGILPKFPIWDDVCTFDGKPWRGIVDVVCGGFPCQDISAAGKGAGIEGERSGLWKEMARIVGEIRPRYVFIENSPLLRTRGLSVVLKDLAEMGYDARWGVLGAGDVGASHERSRLWVLANSTKGRLQGGESRKFISTEEKAVRDMDWRQFRVQNNIPKPYGVRSLNGVANGVDRLKAIGNGQVPAVAATAFRILTEGLT